MGNKILLFIPMFNCEKQISRVLSQLTLEVQKLISEIIIVNNRSTDNSEQSVINYLNTHKIISKILLLRNDDNYGLGGSHKIAFDYAINNKFDYIIVLHGDDQGNINDILDFVKKNDVSQFDCILGARFMRGSLLKGYSFCRVIGNYIFNFLFSLVTGKKIYDLGSGLNMYKVDFLSTKYYLKYPDTLYFNDFMLLVMCYYKCNIKFIPITWMEEDQISNNKLINFSLVLLNMLKRYIFEREEFVNSDMRNNVDLKYNYEVIYKGENI